MDKIKNYFKTQGDTLSLEHLNQIDESGFFPALADLINHVSSQIQNLEEEQHMLQAVPADRDPLGSKIKNEIQEMKDYLLAQFISRNFSSLLIIYYFQIKRDLAAPLIDTPNFILKNIIEKKLK